jgi:hypothetical protein
MSIKKSVGFSLALFLGAQTAICSADNYVPNSTITSSSLAGDLSPAFISDGRLDTSWGAGTPPVVWIEFDFQAPKAITEIRATIDQFPVGNTVHQIYLDNVLSHTWEGETKTGQELVLTAPAGVSVTAQKVRIETVVSPSWVGWKELSISGPDAASAPNPVQPKNNFAVLSDNLDIAFTLLEYKTAQESLLFRGHFTHIGKNAAGDLLWKLRDHHDMTNPHGYTDIPRIDQTLNKSLRIDSISAGKISYWADLEFIGDNGALVWRLKDFGQN